MHSKTLDLLTTYQLNIMKILMLIFGVMSSDGHLELINRKWQENPNYVEGNGEVWGYYTYKDRPIMLQYCSERGDDGE